MEDKKMLSQEAWEEKQARKLERYQELASRCKRESESVRASGDKIANMIPFGQPILIGHHSQRRHERDIERIHNSMRKSIELSEKSEYYQNKVDNLLNPRAISSDNPNAITLLEAKLDILLKKRESIKDRPHEAYELSNLSQNIRSVKLRIEHLKKLSQVEEKEWTFGENRVKIDPDENRVKVFFPGKPSEEIRTELKSNGFRWSPYNGCWQRQISRWSLDIAKKIAGG
jgi:hypothetical protein